ncbi:MAG: hypothetical protein LBN04_03815 [Oscillospiraceae bacterium]|jgi:hypothetical protein|nr:hypothetical protein [Oscillospiraceae bacterium]
MRKRLCALLLLFALLLCTLPAQAELPADVPEGWHLVYEADDLLSVAKQVILTYHGYTGMSQKAQVRTAGLHVVKETHRGNTITLVLAAAACSYDVSSGTPVRVSGIWPHMRMVLAQEGNAYTLLAYQEPRDGQFWVPDMQDIFGERTAQLIVDNQQAHGRLSSQDAEEEAERYIETLQTGVRTGTWQALLPPGSNPDAAALLRPVLPYGCPPYAGKSVVYDDQVLHTLLVDGEQSLSGILTYQAFSAKGTRIAYARLTVQDGTVQLLDGALPDRTALYAQYAYPDALTRPGETHPVYTAPGKDALRGGHGKATVSTNGRITAIGREGDWALIYYELGQGEGRLGYIAKGALRNWAELPDLQWGDAIEQIDQETPLTDDPQSLRTLATLPAGTKVTLLANTEDDAAWGYVEATDAAGRRLRGFLPRSAFAKEVTP